MPSEYPPGVYAFLEHVKAVTGMVGGLPIRGLSAAELEAWQACLAAELVEPSLFAKLGCPPAVVLTGKGEAALRAPRQAPTGKPTPPATADAPTHSPDFTSVDWFGTPYAFSKGNQAETVRLLWEEYERGAGSLGQGTIGEKLGAADSFALRKLFRHRKADGTYQRHPAWGTMIQQASKGVYRLVPPPAKKQ